MSSDFVAGGAGEDEGSVGVSSHGPAAVVDEPVVEGAEPGGVVEDGLAAVGPPDDVVGFGGWAAAAAERAPAVLFDPGGAFDGVGEAALGFVRDVEDGAVAAEDGGQEFGVAGESAHGVGGLTRIPDGSSPQASRRSRSRVV